MDRKCLDRLATDQGYYFDEQAGQRVINFVEKFCRQSKGEYAGKALELIPWQKEFLSRLYGWRRPDKTRRYRHAGVWVAKKNGKTTLMSALALYHLLADGEPGAEVYIIANDVQQASICFSESANMVEQSPMLAKRLEVLRSTKRIIHPQSKSLYRAMSSEKAGKHGYNSSCLIFDELAFQKDRELWDILRYSTAFRKQPLTLTISTAGYDRDGIGYEQYEYAKSVASGEIQDLHFLPLIFEAQAEDDWTAEPTWRKANPSLGYTIPVQDFQEAVEEAKSEPRKESNFLALRLNRWVGSADQWISCDDWQQCKTEINEDDLQGRDCFIGLDLARRHDLASYVLIFPVDGDYYLVPRFFLPKDLAQRKEHCDKVPYLLWARQGHVTLTDGNVIDYSFIREAVRRDAKKFNIVELGYDPHGAELLCNQQLCMEDNIFVVEVRQGIITMAQPSLQFARLLKEKRIKHNGNPCLTWNANNVTVRTDPNGNIIPDKKHGTSRIDGIVAAIIGLSRALVGNVTANLTVW